MKKIVLILSVVFSFTLVNTALAQKNAKMGYVNLSQIFDEYERTKDYDVKLEKVYKDFDEQRNKKIEEIREAQGKLGLLKEDEKEALEAKIEEMKANLLEFDRQNKTDLSKERNDRIREILLEIEKVISDYAKKEGYSIILDNRFIMYGDEDINLTDKILKILNSSEKK